MTEEQTRSGPHDWARKGWRFWLCRHCFAPKGLHPRTGWPVSRSLHDNRYFSEASPHFREGW